MLPCGYSPSTITNSRVRRYFLVCGSRTIGARAVVHLGLFSWSRQNHRAWLQWLVSTQLAHVALDRLIATVEPALSMTKSCQIAVASRPRPRPNSMASRNGSQTLADGIRLGFSTSRPVDSTPNPVVTSLAGFALLALAFPLSRKAFGVGVGCSGLAGLSGPASDPVVTSSLGRFCRRPPSPCARRPHPDTGRLQIGASRFSPHPGLLFDAPQWPSESSQGYHLLSFRFAQDVAHADRSYNTSCRNQRPRLLLSLAGFEVTLIGRF